VACKPGTCGTRHVSHTVSKGGNTDEPTAPYGQPQSGAWDQNYGGAVQPADRYQPAYAPQSPQARNGQQPPQHAGLRYGLRGAEPFWYVLGCVAMGVAYFSKIPAKKAACEVLAELQHGGQGRGPGVALDGAESFWYVLMCLAFGGGYFAKVSAKKALWEVVGMVQSAPGDYTAALGRALYGYAPSPQRGF
jgi:hypothetical protein